MLLEKLHELTKEMQLKSSFASRADEIDSPQGSPAKSQNGFLVQDLSRKENLESTFQMVLQSWFQTTKYSEVLQNAFENEHEPLLVVL